MTALYDLLSGFQQGGRAADTAMNGMRPSGPQPMGSPQLAVNGIGDLQSLIAGLNSVAEKFRASGLPKSNEYVLDIIGCTRELQGIVVGVQKEIQQMQQQQIASNPAMPAQAQAGLQGMASQAS